MGIIKGEKRGRPGKWIADYRDGAGIRRWKTFDTKRAAEDFLDAERPKCRQWSRALVDPDITLEKYAARWKTQIAATVKPRTVEAYTQILDQHILPVFGSLKVQHLKRRQIKNLLLDKLNGGMARNTVRNLHACLRVMLEECADDNLILANPSLKLSKKLHLISSPRSRQEDIKAMTAEQRQTFLTAASAPPDKGKPDDRRYYPLFFLLAGTGMRLGEGLAVQWEDLDLTGRSLSIKRAISERGMLQTPKAGHGRTVELSRALCQVLGQVEGDRKAEKLRRGWTDLPPWILCTPLGTRFDARNVRKVMGRILKKAGLPGHFTPHCLRHTYASLLLQQGAPVVYVQEQLGHASISLTVDTYGKWLPKKSEGALDRLDPLPEKSGSKMVAMGGGENTQVVENMVPPTRIERAARGLGNRCSIRLSYGGSVYNQHVTDSFKEGKMAGFIAC